MQSTLQAKTNIFKLTAAAILTAVGIIIPMFMPLRISIEPASYTFASHVVLFLAMFISPKVAAAVVLGTTTGFFLGGFPPTVVFRAASHIIFVMAGAMYLQRINKFELKGVRLRIFSLVLALIHGGAEFLAVIAFYSFAPEMGMHMVFRRGGLFFTFFLLVGVGSVIHSLVDFELAMIIKRVLARQESFRKLTSNA